MRFTARYLPYRIILQDNTHLCDDLMSIVKAFAIYVRENSSRMSQQDCRFQKALELDRKHF